MHLNLRVANGVGRRLLSTVIISLAIAVGAVHADEIALASNAPDRYVVAKGDTLWAIAGKFLKDPWKWPNIWNMNRDEIKNPHWIYPGDVIVLDYVNGQPQLRLLKNDANDNLRSGGTKKLSPGIRITQFDEQAAPPIPTSVIEPFLNKPQVIDAQTLINSPRIALAPDDRLSMSMGDEVTALNVNGESGSIWQSFHSPTAIKDPQTGELLGYEVEYTGDLSLQTSGKVGTLKVLTIAKEIAVGDRLIPRERANILNYVPHAPSKPISGKIISSYGDSLGEVGPYATVLLNRGEKDGLELGHVLYVFKAARAIQTGDKNEPVLYAPQQKVANLLVYRVFSRLSYALVLDSIAPVKSLDDFRQP